MTEPSPTQYIPPEEPARPDPEASPELTPGTPAQPAGPVKQTSGMAITAMVLGICGLVICPLILSIPAIVFGAIAMKDINRKPDELDGKGMAIAGFVTGIVGTALSLIFIIIAIAVGIAEDNGDAHDNYHYNPGPGRDYNLD